MAHGQHFMFTIFCSIPIEACGSSNSRTQYSSLGEGARFLLDFYLSIVQVTVHVCDHVSLELNSPTFDALKLEPDMGRYSTVIYRPWRARYAVWVPVLFTSVEKSVALDCSTMTRDAIG